MSDVSKKAKSKKNKPDERRMGAGREIIESVVIAFVLAFLFRTFEAEAYVIPTGSMASSLMGVHKDVECEACGFQYQVGASQEEDAKEAVAAFARNMSKQEQQSFLKKSKVTEGVCPNCRFSMKLGIPDDDPTFPGDRILVSKFAYQFAEPQRWDVIVFRYPKQSWTNYIKRLIGLPGETIDIRGGDIFVKPPGGEQYTIARKPEDKLLAMARIVHDTEFVPMLEKDKSIYDLGWPARWQAAPDWLELAKKNGNNPLASWGDPGNEQGKFQPAADFKSYSADGTSNGMTWLRYLHNAPTAGFWEDMLSDGKLDAEPTRAELAEKIYDYLSYNDGKPNVFIPPVSGGKPELRHTEGQTKNWVGDLILEATLHIEGSSGEIILEAVDAGYFFRCTINVESGEAELSIVDSAEAVESDMAVGGRSLVFDASSGREPSSVAKGQTPFKGSGEYRIRFANVDDELRLWVGDADAWGEPEQVVFDSPTTYSPLPTNGKPDPSTPADLSPVGIGVKGTALTVSHLRVLRDIYYTKPINNPGADYLTEVAVPAGKLFAMGDNSDRSKDSRYFGFVDVKRELIGKALYVYWPHAWNTVWPNFDRMSFVR